MHKGKVDKQLILRDSQIWRAPHLVQALDRGDTRWDEFLSILVQDLAFGMKQKEWIGKLLGEGNLGLADKLSLQINGVKISEPKVAIQEQEWRDILDLAFEDESELRNDYPYDLTQDDLDYLDGQISIAKEFADERAYGDAVAAMEVGVEEMRQLLERRRMAAAKAFDDVDQILSHEKSEVVQIHPQQFPGGQNRHRIAMLLLNRANTSLLSKNYDEALQLAQFARDLRKGYDIPEAIEQSVLTTTSPLPESISHTTEPELESSAFIRQQPESYTRTWIRADDEYLVDNHDVLSNQQLAKRFSVPEDEIAERIAHLGLSQDTTSGRKAKWRNPYVAGKPLKNKVVFVGREDVFDFIADNVGTFEEDEDRNLIVLLGHRRTGKTSILLQLQKNRREILGNRIPIFIDMEGLLPFPGGIRNFFWKLATKVWQELSDQLGVQMAEPQEDDYRDPSWAFQQFLREALAQLDGKGLVMMFDEFHAIEPGQSVLDINVYKMLRSVIQHNERVDFILAGTMQMEVLMRDYKAAMFGSAITKKIDFLDEQDARKLITRPVQAHVQYTPEAVDFIVDVTASHPYFVQLVCWTLTNYLVDRGKKVVQVNDVERILPWALERGVHFDEIWATDTTELERYIMALVGELAVDRTRWCPVAEVAGLLGKKSQMPSNHDELDEAISNLTNRRILRRSDDGNSVQFQVFVFGSWVNANKPFEVVRRDIRAEEASMRRRISRQPLGS